jgi:diketogulonate reductase-like aldo/keto reductase
MKTVQLNNGVQMPILGFGVFQIRDAEECEKSVCAAIEAGYRLIDTAASYRNEVAVGNAIRKSGVAREELFVTTRLWIQDADEERALSAFQKSLDRLQLNYLDLYLIHQPYGDVHGAWRAMEKLYREGRVRAIGISNFHPDRAIDLITHNQIVPAANQIEVHPFCQQIASHEFRKGNDVQVESWGSFAEGRNGIFENEILRAIGASHQKLIAQVILRWLIQRNVVAIPKSVHTNRIIENFSVSDFELSDDEMAQIAALDTKASAFFDHRDPDVVKRLGSIKLDI